MQIFNQNVMEHTTEEKFNKLCIMMKKFFDAIAEKKWEKKEMEEGIDFGFFKIY